MEVKHDVSSIPITSSEITYLWNTYLFSSKSKHILMYNVNQCDDKEIRSIMQLSLDLTAQNMSKIKAILDAENQIVPYAFSEEDIYVNSPKIYTDKLFLYILKLYTMVGLSNYGLAISLSPRQDIRKFFTDTMIANIDLSNKIDDLALEKGIYLRTPNIPPTQKVEFAEDKNILGRIIGHSRPLMTSEISSIYSCSMVDSICEAILLGTAQTIGDSRLKEFLSRARMTLKEHVKTLNEILYYEDLAFPPSLESEVLNSSTPTYSDRLTMFTSYTTLYDVITMYSLGKIGVMRKDVVLTLTKLSNEILLLAKDATDLLLERKWLEEMPKNIEREEIMH